MFARKKHLIEENVLVAMLRNKEQKGMSLLYDNYSGALYNIILRRVKSTETAEDVLQEVFIKIWKNFHQYSEDKGRLFTWMINIANNEAISVLRSKGNRKEQVTAAITEADCKSYSVITETDHIGVRQLIDRLEEKYREVIDSIYFKGMTQSEVTRELQIPLGTVKTRTAIAYRELKKQLAC